MSGAKIPGGYYIKARSIQESWIAHAAPCVREVFDWLIRECNRADNARLGILRGQTVRTVKDIQEGLHWFMGNRKQTYTGDQIEYALKTLSVQEMITKSKTARGMLITVCNYDYYQNPKNYGSGSGSADNTPSDTARLRQPSATINKKEKDSNNKESNSNYPKEEGESGTPAAPTAPPDRKKSLAKKRQDFIAPTMQEARDYFVERMTGRWDLGKSWLEAEAMVDHYEANGWIQNGNKPIVDWKAAARQWLRRAIGNKFKNEIPDPEKQEVPKPPPDPPKEKMAPDSAAVCYLYDTFIDGTFKGAHVEPGHYDVLKDAGMMKNVVSIIDQIKERARKIRIDQLTGSNDRGEVALLMAYTGDQPDDQLLAGDKESLNLISRRVSVIALFEYLKADGVTDLQPFFKNQTIQQ